MSFDMFASYNKSNKRGALMGNWVEEQALQEATGNSRYREWATQDGVKLTRSSKKEADGSASRVINHTEAENPSNYRASSKLHNPSKHPECQIPASVGPREALRMKILHEQALEIAKASKVPETVPNRFETVSQSTFKGHEFPKQAVKPKARGSMKNTPKDANVIGLSKQQLENADRRFLKATENPSHYTQGMALTHYSYAIKKSSGVNFRSSAINGANPFARSTAFTNDIRDGLKRHAESSDVGSLPPEPLGVTMCQTAAIQKIKLALRVDGTCTLGELQNKLLSMDTSGNQLLSFAEFSEGLSDLGLKLTRQEMEQAMRFFDKDGNGEISVEEFMVALRPTMNQNRMEIVTRVYQLLQEESGEVTSERMGSCYISEAHPDVVNGLKSSDEVFNSFMQYWKTPQQNSEIPFQHWVDYYASISMDIDDDPEFVQLLRSTWGLD